MAQEVTNSSIRVAARLANGFVLDLVKLGGFGRDVIDGLLLVAISQANLARITRDPELQRTYATLHQPPPDEIRRPVSVSAIANSLRIPFETARRRIASLVELGIVRNVARGVIIPTAALNAPSYQMAAEANYGLVRNLYLRLRGIGLLADLPRPAGPLLDLGYPPVRLVIRLSSDYLLRLAEPITIHIGDVVSGLILMDLIQANIGHMDDTEGGDPEIGWSEEGFVPDALRRSARVTTLAERLGIPQETVRRHLRRLLDADLCERKEDGYMVTARILARPPFIHYILDNRSHLHRFFAALAEFGVLSEWEDEVLALRGAA